MPSLLQWSALEGIEPMTLAAINGALNLISVTVTIAFGVGVCAYVMGRGVFDR